MIRCGTAGSPTQHGGPFQHMRRTIAFVLALVAALSPSPAALGSAAVSFTFYGSGFGHGLGMSQWGAYGLALQGWNHDHVLSHFYTGTSVQQAASSPPLLRIGLVQGKPSIRLTAVGGQVDLRLADRVSGQTIGSIPDGETWTVKTTGGQYEVLDASGNQVGGQLWGGVEQNLYAAYVPNHAKVLVPEAGHTYNRGYLEFNIYNCPGSCPLRLILPIAPQAYLYGLGEVPSSWPMEAMEAQAVAARTYAFYKAAITQHRDPCNCALYATSADQVYAGWDKEGGIDGNLWVQAVDSTNGEVITYQGAIIQAFYSSSSGGYTENNENVWGGTPIPYLRGVCDPGDYTPANTNAVWTVSMAAGSVTNGLGLGIGTVTGFSNIVRGVSGRIITMTVLATNGSASISGSTLRSALGLLDDRVWINTDRHVVGEIRTRYDSLNCAPGLPASPQRNVLGGVQQSFAAGAIYENDAQGVTVWLKGPVYDKYLAKQGPAGVLGLPLSGVQFLKLPACARLTCSRATFADGTIYYDSGIGAFELHGPVLDSYAARGGPGGKLGFPTSDVRNAGGGATSATFQHGTLFCPASGACRQSSP